MSRFGNWTFRLERLATQEAYAMCPLGGDDTCDCAFCRNFRLARERVFPEPFLQLLDSLGIDPLKDGEVYHVACPGGLHAYGGWFHFAGELIEDGDFAPVVLAPGFEAKLCKAEAPRIASLKDANVVQLEFDCRGVPWLLDEPDFR
jgi:hypothetical protein